MSEFKRFQRDLFRYFTATGAAVALFAGGLAFASHEAAESFADSGEPALTKKYNQEAETGVIVAIGGLLSAMSCALISVRLTDEMQPKAELPAGQNDITEG
jgi:hypothetical protein